MPCFKGIAVSVHAEGAPLPEYSVQKQSRVSRVNTYIPVPKAKIPKDASSDKAEPSKFAISITLLVPGLSVPYSAPKPTPENPNPHSQIVGGLPGAGGSQRASYGGSTSPYIPITKSENETIAAYIYFDGRAKEEVATLLRPGEETWVNSRWVQVPASEGGGLAEREFLFREVGLERWLNGLDLDGNDAAAKIEKRRQKFEKRRRRRREANGSDEDLDLTGSNSAASKYGGREVLRYGDNAQSPVEKLADFDDDDISSDSDDDLPEAAGQIKVAMFRVLASGEIKRGEYSPQFDAHDDDEDKGNGEEADIDHTTSFAKPKTLDPKSISTQTVTGIDGPDKPFAVFTFFYRGERQLQKMGILTPKPSKGVVAPTKRRSTQLDFSNLAPLKQGGTVGFSSFRENDSSAGRNKSRKKSNGSLGASATVEDSDEDEDDANIVGKMEDIEDKDVKTLLSPEDAKFSGELADGVGRIKLKRQHSAEPINSNSRKSPASASTSVGATPPAEAAPITTQPQLLPNNVFGGLPDDSIVGSPLKKHRASLYDIDNETMQKRLGTGFSSSAGDIVAAAEAAQKPLPTVDNKMEEEL